ncbi:MAG: 50S ribosomal protein L11 methyltransferase [Chloroflexi bacterium]|nr:50S ribosomal protein L11 methyltransferase [Chloroflexota bacterium]
MNWIELSVATDAEGAEAAAALLNEFVSGGAVIEQTITPEPGETLNPARAYTVRAFFSSHAAEALEHAQNGLWHLAQLRAMGEPQVRELAEEDWAEAWKKHYTILRVGHHIVIKPSWLEYTAQAGDMVVELDPGMAFGTGLHPTTRMCLIALEEQVTQDQGVLDVGTGSGILSIAAAKLGAREILALDLDPVAVETTAKNVAINHAENIVAVKRGSLDVTGEGNLFDLICINILAEVISDLAPALAAVLRPGGIVIASGILDYKAGDVIEALRAAGIEVVERRQEEDWVALVAKKEER